MKIYILLIHNAYERTFEKGANDEGETSDGYGNISIHQIHFLKQSNAERFTISMQSLNGFGISVMNSIKRNATKLNGFSHQDHISKDFERIFMQNINLTLYSKWAISFNWRSQNTYSKCPQTPFNDCLRVAIFWRNVCTTTGDAHYNWNIK